MKYPKSAGQARCGAPARPHNSSAAPLSQSRPGRTGEAAELERRPHVPEEVDVGLVVVVTQVTGPPVGDCHMDGLSSSLASDGTRRSLTSPVDALNEAIRTGTSL